MNTHELYVGYLNGRRTWLVFGQSRVEAYETIVELAGVAPAGTETAGGEPASLSVVPPTERDFDLWQIWVATHDPIPNYVAIVIPVEKAEALAAEMRHEAVATVGDCLEVEHSPIPTPKKTAADRLADPPPPSLVECLLASGDQAAGLSAALRTDGERVARNRLTAL
jgi:hypothetical protein